MIKDKISNKFIYEYNNYILPYMDYYNRWYTLKIIDNIGLSIELGGYKYHVYLINQNDNYFWQLELLSTEAYYNSKLNDSKDSFYDILYAITEDVINLINLINRQ